MKTIKQTGEDAFLRVMVPDLDDKRQSLDEIHERFFIDGKAG